MDGNLRQAIIVGNIEYVKEYIDINGVVNFNLKDGEGQTILHLAVYHNRLGIVKIILDNGADINIKDIYDRTPLYIAVYWEQTETVEYLLTMQSIVDEQSSLSRGANINAKNNGWTSLHTAAYDEHLEMVKLLLTHGANRNIVNKNGRKPIDLTKNKEIITLLETWQDPMEIKEPDI